MTSTPESAALSRRREMLLTSSIDPVQPISAFAPGDVLELPGIDGVLRVEAVAPFPDSDRYRLVAFAGMPVPAMLAADMTCVPRLMLRRWPDFPCLFCRRTATVQHDMVTHGRPTTRICANCSG
ncbi:hypothetical protein [Streptomyces albogriseolus]|uniref:hypothetical protein n=1 Tax=Streptomyces albogriseolus TaxID=1887 RepID=UPI00345F5D30